jgi:hypothetical protein
VGKNGFKLKFESGIEGKSLQNGSGKLKGTKEQSFHLGSVQFRGMF